MKKRLSIFLALYLISLFIFNCKSTNAATIPKLQVITQPQNEYKQQDTISIKVQTPNYGGKVEYRVILYNGTTKATKSLWNTPKTGYYYRSWQPSGTYQFEIRWSALQLQPGAYSMTVLVRRANSNNSYDSYIDTRSFTVIGEEGNFNLEESGLNNTNAPWLGVNTDIENVKKIDKVSFQQSNSNNQLDIYPEHKLNDIKTRYDYYIGYSYEISSQRYFNRVLTTSEFFDFIDEDGTHYDVLLAYVDELNPFTSKLDLLTMKSYLQNEFIVVSGVLYQNYYNGKELFWGYSGDNPKVLTRKKGKFVLTPKKVTEIPRNVLGLTVIEVPNFYKNSSEKSTTVYINDIGNVFHLENCTELGNTKIPITYYDAKQKDYEVCPICRPDKFYSLDQS